MPEYIDIVDPIVTITEVDITAIEAKPIPLAFILYSIPDIDKKFFVL